MLFNKKLLVLCVVLLTFLTNAKQVSTTTHTTSNKVGIELKSNSRALMGQKTQSWQEGFMSGSSGCISVIKNGVICGWTAVSAGIKCAWSYIKCIIPKCSKCCAKGWFSWACVPCKCSWNCNSKKCKEEFNKVGKACKITADDCIKAFKGLGNATKKFFENVGKGIAFIANKIAHAVKWVAEKAWAAVKWVWDKIKSLLDLIKIFQVASAIGKAFQCFGKLGSRDQIKSASGQAGNVKGIAQSQGKNGIISKIDSVIPGFKAFVCCLQSTAIGKVLNKWGKKLLDFHKSWKGLKVGSFIDDPAIVVSLAASVASGYSVGTSLDIAFSTAFNVGLYWTVCGGFVTDVGAGVSIVVNLFRKWTQIPGQSVAISFSVGIPSTPIGVGAGVVLPIGASSIEFGAVNVEVGASNGVSPVSIGGHVCDTKELVSFNLLELIGNILTANNECPSKIPTNSGSGGGSSSSGGSSSGGSSSGGGSSSSGGGSSASGSATLSASGNLYSSRVSDSYYAWSGFTKTLGGNVKTLRVTYTWKDQGWGNRKGFIQLYAYSGSSHVATLTIAPHGVAPHGWTNVNYNVPTSQLSKLKKGIVLKLMYRVGGGGGHRLYVNSFKAYVTYGYTPSTVAKSGSNLYSSRVSDSYYHCCFSTTMTGRVSAIKVYYRWRDQGWGNRKGYIKLEAQNGGSKTSLTIASGVAPHGWTTVNYNVPSNQLGNLRKGTILRLYYRVGGGGGHRLYVYYFKVTLYYTGQELGQVLSPVTISATENVEAFENMEAMDDIANRRLMTNYILKEHKDKMIANNELKLREEMKANRRLEMEQEEEARVDAMENGADGPTGPKPFKIDSDPCAPLNIEAELAFLKKRGLDKKKPEEIASAFCVDKCLKPTDAQKGDSECSDLRADMCNSKMLGGGLTTLRSCCVALTTRPEVVVFRARKFCAKWGKIAAVKPTKEAFCKAASSSANDIAKDYDILNTIMDGCGLHFNDGKCGNLANESTAAGLARVANTLCPKKKLLQNEHLAGAVAGGLAISALLIAFGVKKFRTNKNSEQEEFAYGQVPEF